jgi:[ribosomal protein S5]-alanine N-acetyltransferase
MIQIITPRLLLREFHTDDAEQMFLLNSDPDVIQFTGDSAYPSVEEAKKSLIIYDQYRKYNRGRLAMITRDTSEFLGWCGLKFLEDTNETDFGFRLHKKYWNKGFASEAGKACLEYGFNTLTLPIIIAHAMIENKASIHVLEKLGMKPTKDFEFNGNKGVYMEISREEFLSSIEI